MPFQLSDYISVNRGGTPGQANSGNYYTGRISDLLALVSVQKAVEAVYGTDFTYTQDGGGGAQPGGDSVALIPPAIMGEFVLTVAGPATDKYVFKTILQGGPGGRVRIGRIIDLVGGDVVRWERVLVGNLFNDPVHYDVYLNGVIMFRAEDVTSSQPSFVSYAGDVPNSVETYTSHEVIQTRVLTAGSSTTVHAENMPCWPASFNFANSTAYRPSGNDVFWDFKLSKLTQ